MIEMKFNEKIMKEVIDNIVNEFEKEKYEKYIDEIKKIEIDKNIDIESFYYRFIKPLNDKIDVMINYYVDKKENYELLFLIKNYWFIKSSFEKIIENFEGFCCCADKSRRIIKQLFFYFRDGKYPNKINDFASTQIVFTDFQEILNFFKSLHLLYFGNNEAYLKQVDLIKNKIKLYQSLTTSILNLKDILYNKLEESNRLKIIESIKSMTNCWDNMELKWDKEKKLLFVTFIVKQNKAVIKLKMKDLFFEIDKKVSDILKNDIEKIFNFILKENINFNVEKFIRWCKNYLNNIINIKRIKK